MAISQSIAMASSSRMLLNGNTLLIGLSSSDPSSWSNTLTLVRGRQLCEQSSTNTWQLLSTVPVGERQYVRARVLIKNLPKRSKFFLLLQRQTAPTAADDTKDRGPVRSATKSHCECLVLVLWFCLNQHPCVSIACGACGKLRRPGGTTTTTTYQRAVLQRRRIFFVFKSSRRRASQAWIWNSMPLLV